MCCNDWVNDSNQVAISTSLQQFSFSSYKESKDTGLINISNWNSVPLTVLAKPFYQSFLSRILLSTTSLLNCSCSEALQLGQCKSERQTFVNSNLSGHQLCWNAPFVSPSLLGSFRLHLKTSLGCISCRRNVDVRIINSLSLSKTALT